MRRASTPLPPLLSPIMTRVWTLEERPDRLVSCPSASGSPDAPAALTSVRRPWVSTLRRRIRGLRSSSHGRALTPAQNKRTPAPPFHAAIDFPPEAYKIIPGGKQ